MRAAGIAPSSVGCRACLVVSQAVKNSAVKCPAPQKAIALVPLVDKYISLRVQIKPLSVVRDQKQHPSLASST